MTHPKSPAQAARERARNELASRHAHTHFSYFGTARNSFICGWDARDALIEKEKWTFGAECIKKDAEIERLRAAILLIARATNPGMNQACAETNQVAREALADSKY